MVQTCPLQLMCCNKLLLSDWPWQGLSLEKWIPESLQGSIPSPPSDTPRLTWKLTPHFVSVNWDERVQTSYLRYISCMHQVSGLNNVFISKNSCRERKKIVVKCCYNWGISFPWIIIIIDPWTEYGVDQKQLRNFRSQLGEKQKLPQINISNQ